ncbi:competence type IV pilus minor pilin ComGF [Bacillus sp. FJAT-49736]|uniref:competence type IV pilus minor pilin ComGF n=1 Tax=Bacillus sp. FJAT-49736 TaxID=2833582 RepID=UPI001BC99908|nr:competence type IV pilus minor pilin ComGF [Bacillus sp. FJAT-49736]MBS4173451.1 pilin [Bacillus sp. FJAT-49736]
MKVDKPVFPQWRNEGGFTLVESIFVLMIVVTILGIFPLIIKGFSHINQSLSTEVTFEWNTFLMQLRKEIRNSSDVGVAGDKLILYVNGEKVTYEQYGSLIRRRVHDSGHEVVLQKVKNAEFLIHDNKMELIVHFTNDRMETAAFSFFSSSITENQSMEETKNEK